MISTVVFDFDGTLIDSNAIKREGFFAVVAGHPGGSARMEAVIERNTGDRRHLLSTYLQEAREAGVTSLPSLDELVRSYSEQVDTQVAAAAEMPGAIPLLRELRGAGRRLYLSSATPIENLRNVLERRGWLGLFDDVFGHPATKEQTLRRILAAHNLDARSLAVVGDGADDRDSAARVGCAFFPVGEARGARARERVFTLPELLDVLSSPHPSAD